MTESPETKASLFGTLGKIYSEGLENIDDKEREGVTSTGTAPVPTTLTPAVRYA